MAFLLWTVFKFKHVGAGHHNSHATVISVGLSGQYYNTQWPHRGLSKTVGDCPSSIGQADSRAQASHSALACFLYVLQPKRMVPSAIVLPHSSVGQQIVMAIALLSCRPQGFPLPIIHREVTCPWDFHLVTRDFWDSFITHT